MEIHVIEPKMNTFNKLRVCAYCRVSTEEEEQANSLENQMEHYEEEIRSNPSYEFAGIYHDFGISGFKENRPGFQKMLQAARDHEINLIITKSVSRFCRNTDTLLKAVRELKDLGVGVIFELQHINTLATSGEILLTVLAAFAQAESENYSALGKMVYTRKYEAGIPVQYLERSFGYDHGPSGEFLPDPGEAPWVKKIYELCADGYRPVQIARHLNEQGVHTKAGSVFTSSTVIRILENEIYKGDYIMHKYYVNAERKEVKNRGEVDAWYIKDDHPALVSRKLWDRAQERLSEMREYLATGSVVGSLDEETYPYKKQLFCAECGFPLYRRVYSNGNRVSWICSGEMRYLKKFCAGISVPDSIIRGWGELPGNVYVRSEKDQLGRTTFRYVRKKTWARDHKRKEPVVSAPELTTENYPYKDHIFCAGCGSKLTRSIGKHGDTIWTCNGRKHKGRAFCEGIRIPDDVIRGWGEIKHDIFISRKEDKHGQRSYSYSRQKDA